MMSDVTVVSHNKTSLSWVSFVISVSIFAGLVVSLLSSLMMPATLIVLPVILLGIGLLCWFVKRPDKFIMTVAVYRRSRVNCLQNAAKKVKIGGYLILDDSHRERYQPAFDSLVGYSHKRHNFGLLQTTIFQRID